MIEELFDKWYIKNYDKSGNKQHYAYGLLIEAFKAGYEAAMQVNNNCIKSDVVVSEAEVCRCSVDSCIHHKGGICFAVAWKCVDRQT